MTRHGPPVAGAAAVVLALAGLWQVTDRAEVGLGDAVNAELARSAAAFVTVVTPSDGGRGYDASRLLSGVGALAISSFWPGGLQGALGRTPLLPDTIGLTPLPDPIAALLDRGAPSAVATHSRYRTALAPLFDRDRREVLGWIAVWGGLGHPSPGPLAWIGSIALVTLVLLLLVGVRVQPAVPPGRRAAAALAAGLGLVVTAIALAEHLRGVAARATEVRLTTMRRLIEIAATADGVQRARLPEIAVGAGVSEATLDPAPRPPLERVTISGVHYARTVAATPRAGDDTGLEIRILPSEAGLGATWAWMAALVVAGLAGLALAFRPV